MQRCYSHCQEGLQYLQASVLLKLVAMWLHPGDEDLSDVKQCSYKIQVRVSRVIFLFINIRRHLFYLLDYVTFTEIFQIGDREKNQNQNRWSQILS